MEFENEKKNEEQTAQEQQSTTNQEGGYQYRAGRSPRPRIHQQTRPYNQGGYNRYQNQDEGGFRPEGFGAGLQSQAPQRSSYRPRNNYNQEVGYQPRQQGGYRPRPQYGRSEEHTSELQSR